MRIVETHLSRVLLTGDRAYKIKKPVVLPFVDYGTPERRRAACEAEVRLNRRLAPDVYLGVRGVVPEPARLGALRRSRRSRRRRLRRRDAALRHGRDAGGPRALGHGERGHLPRARRVARRVPRRRRRGRRRRGRGGQARARRHLRDAAPPRGGRDRAGALELRRPHGALEASSSAAPRAGSCATSTATCAPSTSSSGDRFRAVDCLEFSDALRGIDVGADLAFLVMDLHRLGRRGPRVGARRRLPRRRRRPRRRRAARVPRGRARTRAREGRAAPETGPPRDSWRWPPRSRGARAGR